MVRPEQVSCSFLVLHTDPFIAGLTLI
eukprot:COSAG04_NODE_32364_length_251_cov_1.026316_2_plen_26_part_01